MGAGDMGVNAQIVRSTGAAVRCRRATEASTRPLSKNTHRPCVGLADLRSERASTMPTPGERNPVDPGERRASTEQLFLDDPPARLLDRGVPRVVRVPPTALIF